MTTPHDDLERDPERDPWLSQALRHAPDANAAPPPELSDAILRSARNAVKTPPSAARPRESRRMQWWSWLARPPVAAGFATVMVAVLVGVMWFDRPPDEMLPANPAATAAAPAVDAMPAPAPTSATTPTPAPTPVPAVGTLREAAGNGAGRADSRRTESRTTAAREREAKPAAVPAPEPRPLAKRERAATASSNVPASVLPPAAPAAPTATSPLETRPEPVPFSDKAAAPAAAAPAPTQAREEGYAEAPRDSRESVSPRSKTAPATAPALAARAPGAQGLSGGAAPFVIDDPERWRWQRGGEPQAMTPAVLHWVESLHRAARWRVATDQPPPATETETLILSRDGAPYATIHIGSDAAWLSLRDGMPLVAPLALATAAALKSGLLAATP